MKERIGNMWFPFWSDSWLLGSVVEELELDEQAVFVRLLCIAAKDKGWIRGNVSTGYKLPRLSGLISVPEEPLKRTLKKCIQYGKISTYENNIYRITNWKKYQLVPRHMRRFEKSTDARSSFEDTMSCEKDTKSRAKDENKDTNQIDPSNQCSLDSHNLNSCVKEVVDRQIDREILDALESFFPLDSPEIEQLTKAFPKIRLIWASTITHAVMAAREVKKPTTYFLRVLRNEEQWQRYLWDEYALGRAEALKKRKEQTMLRRKRLKTEEKRQQEAEKNSFVKYFDSISESLRRQIEDHVLQKWASANDYDLEIWKERGWLINKTTWFLLKAHIKGMWLTLGKPEKYLPDHLDQIVPPRSLMENEEKV